MLNDEELWEKCKRNQPITQKDLGIKVTASCKNYEPYKAGYEDGRGKREEDIKRILTITFDEINKKEYGLDLDTYLAICGRIYGKVCKEFGMISDEVIWGIDL